jgi:nucleoside-diphosphate-sugar epimerase
MKGLSDKEPQVMTPHESNYGELHVVFGTGPLGKATARALVQMGRRVRMVNRSGSVADIPAGVEVVRSDASNPASAIQASAGASVIYQCAQPAYHDWAEHFPTLQTSILGAASAHGARLVVGDNLYLYGDPDGRPITEDSPQRPVSRKGRVRAAMAAAVMEAHERGNVRATIGRASNFIGPEYDVMGDLVFYPALAGKTANLYGDPDVPHSFTYIPDFGRGLAILGTRDEVLGKAWIVPCLAPIAPRELVELIYAEAGHPPRMRAAGRLTMRLFGLFNAGARETVEMLYEFEKPFIVDSSRFERAFEVQATPLPQVIRETVAWFRANPRA